MINPVTVLYEEHQFIKRALMNVISLKKLIHSDPNKFKSEMKKYIGFFRNYADNFHHQKEERILFPEIAKKKEHLAEGIVKEMNDNHADFRDMLTEIESFVNEGKYDKAFREFEKYNQALLDHIAVEDDELFQTAMTILDSHELEKIYYRFEDTDKDLGKEYKKSMEDMLNDI